MSFFKPTKITSEYTVNGMKLRGDFIVVFLLMDKADRSEACGTCRNHANCNVKGVIKGKEAAVAILECPSFSNKYSGNPAQLELAF